MKGTRLATMVPLALLLMAYLPPPGLWAQDPEPPPPAATPGAPGGPVIDWDRDFDLILELRQAEERQISPAEAKLRQIAAQVESLQKDLKDLEARRQVFTDSVTDEGDLGEMLRQGARSPEEARKNLERKIDEVKGLIEELEDRARRTRRGGR